MSGKVRLKPNGYLDEDPMTLQDIVYRYICSHLGVISYQDENRDGVRCLNEGLVLPNDICDRLLKAYQQFHRHLDDKVINLFRDTSRTSLKIVHLRNSTLTNEGNFNTVLSLNICMYLSIIKIFNIKSILKNTNFYKYKQSSDCCFIAKN